MRNYDEKDIRFYAEAVEGDFITDETGDFSMTTEAESARQDMTNRIRTQKTNWRSHPNIGADLELLEGEANTKETALKAESQVYEALTYDNRFDAIDLTVRAVPTSVEHLDVFTILDSDRNGTVVITQPLDL